MFPFLPALIILLLQGPSNSERLLAQGRVPSGSEAIYRAVTDGHGLCPRERVVLAQLLATQDPTDLASALIALIDGKRSVKSNPVIEAKDRPAISDVTPGILSTGFVRAQRPRDGPNSKANP